jgi:WD40 repeat protein
LRLSGAVKSNAERLLTIRNRVYKTVFNEAWVRERTPSDAPWITSTAAIVILAAIIASWYLFIFPKAYVQALESASNDTEVAYQAYDHLRKPLHSSKADNLLAQFFERRDDRDSAILVRARSTDRVELSELVGTHYPSLQLTLRHDGPVSAVAFSPDGKLVATASWDHTTRVFEAASGREIALLAHQNPVMAVVFSPDGKLLVAQTSDWLHLYQRNRNRWSPIANRDLPVIWPNTIRFLPTDRHCPKCVEVVRDVSENFLKLDRIDFGQQTATPIKGAPQQLVSEWSTKLGLTFDSRGRIVPLTSKPRNGVSLEK